MIDDIEAIRSLISPESNPDDALEYRVRTRLLDAIGSQTTQASSRPAVRQRMKWRAQWTVIVAVSLIMFVSGAAIAASVAGKGGQSVSAEFSAARPGGGMMELSTTSLGTTKVSTASDDRSVCTEFTPTVRWLASSGSCGVSFSDSGVAVNWTCGTGVAGDDPHYVLRGIAVDAVKTVNIEIQDGDAVAVPVKNNTFEWVATTTARQAIGLVTDVNGAKHSVPSASACS